MDEPLEDPALLSALKDSGMNSAVQEKFLHCIRSGQTEVEYDS